MYEKYLSMQSVPAGKILETILKKRNIAQKELAVMLNEYLQRIYDLIKGNRKFNIRTSLAIEKALGIDIAGFFLKIQTNYEIYSHITELELQIHPDLSLLSKALFWDTRIEKINWIKNKDWVIKRTFEYGNEREIEEIIRFYGKETITAILPRFDRRSLYKKAYVFFEEAYVFWKKGVRVFGGRNKSRIRGVCRPGG